MNHDIENIAEILENHEKSIKHQKEITNNHLILFSKVLEDLQKESKKIKTIETELTYMTLYFEIAMYFSGFLALCYLIYNICNK